MIVYSEEQVKQAYDEGFKAGKESVVDKPVLCAGFERLPEKGVSVIQEFGKCDMCGKEAALSRKYYHYDIDCECCLAPGKNHFETVRHCGECEPQPPRRITVTLRPLPE